MKKTKKLVFLSFLTAIALVIYIIEAQIPVLFPGIKLGLSNVISLAALLIFGPKEALTIMFLRVTLGSFLSGTLSSFMFSLSGGILSNLIMIFMYKKFKNQLSLWSISITGAIFHNIGQLLVAAFVVQDFRIYIYLPLLMISAIITGYFIGVATLLFSKHIKKLNILN